MNDAIFDGGEGFVGSDSGESRLITVYDGGIVCTDVHLARFVKRWSRRLDLLTTSLCIVIVDSLMNYESKCCDLVQNFTYDDDWYVEYCTRSQYLIS